MQQTNTSKDAITRQLTTVRKQVAAIAEQVARGGDGLDLLPTFAAIYRALESVERDLATKRLRGLQRDAMKRAPMGERERRDLAAIIKILRPWETDRA